jgi:hypothetical protein
MILSFWRPMNTRAFVLTAVLTSIAASAFGDTLTFPPSADTLLFNAADNPGLRSTPQGNSEILFSVNVPDGSYNYFPLFRFDLSSLAGNTVTSDATFTLYANGGAQTQHDVYLVSLPEAFSESTTTFDSYNSLAANTNRIGSNLIPGAFASFPTPPTGLVSFTLPEALVQSWIDNPASNLGIGVYQLTSTSTDVNFLSKETANPAQQPTLTVTTVPEPATLGMALLGGAAVLLRRRRRTA